MSTIIVFNHVWNPENPQWASPPNWIANSSKKETYGSPWSSLTAVHSTSLLGKVSQKHSGICINDEHRKRMMLSCHRHDMSEYFPMNQLKIARQIFKSLFYCFTIQELTDAAWYQTALVAAITPLNLRWQKQAGCTHEKTQKSINSTCVGPSWVWGIKWTRIPDNYRSGGGLIWRLVVRRS